MHKIEIPSGARYEKVAEHLRDLIAKRSLQPGDSLPSFAMLRRDLGISQATYERAQSLLERDGLVSRKPGRGSFVAHARQATAAGSIALVGLGPVGGKRSGYWGELFEGIRDAARAQRRMITLIDRIDDVADWSGISGLILGAFQEIEAPVPCISLMCQVPGRTAVMADEHSGILAAMGHLHELGHRRIAYLKSTWGANTDERSSAYRIGLLEAGVIPDPRWKRDMEEEDTDIRFFYRSGYLSMRNWMADDWRDLGCTALLAQNDETALGAMDALRGAGYRVPEDVSVVGFDGILDDSNEPSGLTTVAVPLFELGRSAVRQLRLATEVNSGMISLRLEAPLRIGTTTGPAPR